LIHKKTFLLNKGRKIKDGRKRRKKSEPRTRSFLKNGQKNGKVGKNLKFDAKKTKNKLK
jgi:hypothetical protein